MIEKFSPNMMPEMPKAEGEPVIENPEEKPEAVLLSQEKERILADLEDFKSQETSGTRKTVHLAQGPSEREAAVEFGNLTDRDLEIFDRINKGISDEELEDFYEKEFKPYKKSLMPGEGDRSRFMAFLGNKMGALLGNLDLKRMGAQMSKEKSE